MFRQLGPTELLIIVGVIVLLFGAKKLPDLARGSGQALRIFKAETKELRSGDKKDEAKKADAAAADGDDDQDAPKAADSDEIVVEDETARPAEPKLEAERRTDSGD